MMRTSSNCLNRTGSRGLTLLEILLLLGIAAVLAVLLMAGVSRFMAQGQRTQCLSNLRNIGQAMQLYVSDHDGYLPGPLTGGQRLGYSLSVYSDQFHIPRVLGSYLGLPEPETGPRRFAREIACPSWIQTLPAGGDVTSLPGYLAHSTVQLTNGETGRAFGRSSQPREEPLRLVQVAEPASQWALSDIDAGLAPAYQGRLAPGPVHRGFRNVLFYDWHVEAVREE